MLLKKVQLVQASVRGGKISVEGAIQQFIRDRVTVDEEAFTGRTPLMTKGQFVDALKQQCKHEEAFYCQGRSSPQKAKADSYRMRGLKAPSDEVSADTVKKVWQNVGGADLPVRGKVQERSFARVPKATHAEPYTDGTN